MTIGVAVYLANHNPKQTQMYVFAFLFSIVVFIIRMFLTLGSIYRIQLLQKAK